ncbi:uncharacterized protein C05D11.1 [Augochlora pura]
MESKNGFQCVHRLKIDDTVPVYVYKSTNTGVTVCIAEVDGPVVSGYFSFATEADNDDGLPHTLEHLIFLGSECYPYRGVLDLWANRCLASGTNASTFVDTTHYTMTTAGSEGFLSLMPVYLDHILYPTLLDSAYVTEVHHIDGKGEDAGVVYCEMQGIEQTAECLVYTELSRAIFPGHCCYKSVTGGALKNFRESTNNEKVRQYHKDFYRPENLTLIIVGQIKHDVVFEALLSIEEKIMLKGSRDSFKKPWQSPVPALLESKDIDVFYPCDDEDNGIINVGWQGPSVVNEIYNVNACDLLLKYLTDTSVSPLQKTFLEITDPYASNVTYFSERYSVSVLCLGFENVPKSKISLVKDQLLETLNDVHKNGIDMKRMKTLAHRSILERLSWLERSPHDTVAMIMIKHLLYGKDEDLVRRVNQIEDLKKLEMEPESFWLDLLKKCFLDTPMVFVKGIPSLEKQRELTEKEKERVAKQIKELGEEGLRLKQKELEDAIANNNVPVPDELLDSVPIPSTDLISFHQIKSYTTETSEVDQDSRFILSRLPFYTYLDHVNTNFIYLFAIMDTSSIERKYRPYIPLLLEVIMESPVKRNEQLIPYEEIVAELEADTVASDTRIGVNGSFRFSCGSFSQSAILMLHLEIEKYDKGVRWIKELLYDTKLTSSRLKTIATKMIYDVAQIKRKGYKVVNDLMKGLLYNKDSNQFTCSMLRQQKFLTNVLCRLNDEKEESSVISELEIVRKMLTTPKNMTIYIATNVDKLSSLNEDVYKSWDTCFSNLDTSEKTRLDIIPDSMLIKPPHEISIDGCVTGLGCIESSFLIQSCPCINNYQHVDLAPLLVCLCYLEQLEGPMWKLIRGQGLSYSYRIDVNVNEGLLYFSFYKSTNIIAAYKVVKSIVDTHITENKWEKLLFESAKSSLIFHIIEKEQTVGDLVQHSLLSYFKKVPHNYSQQMVKRIYAVKLEDMNRIASQYLPALFDPKQCKTTIVCHPSKVQEVGDAFKAFNHDLKLYNSLEENYLNDW